MISGAGEKAFAAGTDIGQFKSFKTIQDGHDYEAISDQFNRNLPGTGDCGIAWGGYWRWAGDCVRRRINV